MIGNNDLPNEVPTHNEMIEPRTANNGTKAGI
jgi:hypothetical protein